MRGDRERILNLPTVVTTLLVAMTAIQAVVSYGPKDLVFELFSAFAFIPLRLSFALAPQSVIAALDAAGDGAEAQLALALSGNATLFITPLTYALLHGSWTHLAINGLTFAAFGAPVARRLGDSRFLFFLAGCAVAGALTHFAFHALDAAPVVGASAAISGTMAGIVRFAFTPGARLGQTGATDMGESTSLSQLGANRQAMFFLVVWFAVNLLTGIFPEAAGASEGIAWEAHIGGFLFGLLTFGAFDQFWRRN